MNFKKVRSFACFVSYLRFGQVRSRLFLLIKRHIFQIKFLPLQLTAPWFFSDPLALKTLDVAAKPTTFGSESLPLIVDLVGTSWIINVGIDWDPKELDFGTRLEKLNLHYMEYLKKLAPHLALQIMNDWVRSVPPYMHQYWKDSWNSYALSIRVVVWFDILSEVPELLGANQLNSIIGSLSSQVRFLSRNLEDDIGGNHLVKNLRCLARASSFFDGPEVNGYFDLVVRLLHEHLDEQVLSDGMHFELSPSYHLQVMEDFLDIRRAIVSPACRGLQTDDFADLIIKLDHKLSLMASVLLRMTHPDGCPSLMADGGMHMASYPEVVLESLVHDGILPASALTNSTNESWLLPEAGYAGFSSTQSLLIVDCGPVGAPHLPAHGQGDALSFEWSVRGERVFVDPGVYEYHSGPRRAYSRSTSSHNTLTLCGLDQSEFFSAFRVGRRANVTISSWEPNDDGFRLVASHDGYSGLSGSPVHRRTVVCGHENFEIIDEVVGGFAQEASSSMLLAPNVSVVSLCSSAELETTVELAVCPINTSLDRFSVLLSTSAAVRVEESVFFPDFGVSIPTKRLVFEHGQAPCSDYFRVSVAL